MTTDLRPKFNEFASRLRPLARLGEMGGERELAREMLALLVEADLIDVDPADTRCFPRVVSEGVVGSVGANSDGEIRLAVGQRDEWDHALWFTMHLNEDLARAFGAHLLRKVRVTVEVIEGEP